MNEIRTDEKPAHRISQSQWSLAAVILTLAAAGLMYRILVGHHLEQTAALFIGLPSALAIILALSPRAKSATGTILKGMTIALLMSGPVLGEGFICILLAAPLFLLVGLVIGMVKDRARQIGSNRPLIVVIIPLLFASLEGTTPQFTFPVRQVVTASAVIEASASSVEKQLSQTPRFITAFPPFLRLKFPLPSATSGEGLLPGSMRVIHFAGGEGEPGDLTLRVRSRSEGSVVFEALSDTSHIAHWLTWREAQVRWRSIAPGKTAVRWTLVYDRELDPAWYFGPWERYATRLTARYLIDNLADRPGRSRKP